MVRVWGFLIAIVSVLGFAAWASDFITMQGERTIYTVECRDGAWAGAATGCLGEAGGFAPVWAEAHARGSTVIAENVIRNFRCPPIATRSFCTTTAT